ncbi:MAG: hypothetical protein M3335_12050 [Actinomycetota bacterium]|nr:hypothetical protein [Actinomycetota bacterium]
MDFDQVRHRECRRKQRYRSEAEARDVAEQQMRQGSPELKVYECIWCRGWHLARR